MAFIKSTSTVTDTALTIPNLTGGSNGRVVKIISANTVSNASYQDSVTQLNTILIKSGDIYYSAGLITGFSGLTPGAPYFLGLNGTLESSAPTPTATAVALFLGFAINTTDFIFRPGIPISG
jgi:hypothetical protein